MGADPLDFAERVWAFYDEEVRMSLSLLDLRRLISVTELFPSTAGWERRGPADAGGRV